jgi:hypothetical protein
MLEEDEEAEFWSGASRVQDDGAWIAMCACPADDGVVEEGAASAFV